MTQKELLKAKSELLKKDARLLQIKCTYTLLNIGFMELCMDKDKGLALNDLTEKFKALIKNLLDFIDD